MIKSPRRLAALVLIGAALASLPPGRVAAQDLSLTPLEWVDPTDAPDTLPRFQRGPVLAALPEGLREADAPAVVEYRWTVDDDGSYMSSGAFGSHPLLRESPLAMLGDFTLSPARRSGKRVPGEVRAYVIFNPRSADKRGDRATPRLVHVVDAELPAEAITSGQPAAPLAVVVEVEVDETGHVTQVLPGFGETKAANTAAQFAARRFRFEPARENGVAVAARVKVPVLLIPPIDPSQARDYQPPKVVKAPKPEYPVELQRFGYDSEVVVRLEVSVEGRPRNVYAVRSQHPGFDEAAVGAVEQMRFNPATLEGKPVAAPLVMTITFDVHGSQKRPWRIERPKTFPENLPADYRWETAPEMIGYNPPVYPRDALREGREGVVKVLFAIGPSGRVIDATPVGPGDPALQGAAIAAAESFRFKPAAREGQACYAAVAMDFDFSLNGRGEAAVSRDDRRLLKLLAETPDALAALNDLDTLPTPLSRKPPDAPASLRKSGGSGRALVEFIIDRKGFARLPRVLETTSPDMGFAACQAVASWRFVSPRRAGQPVDVAVRIPVVIDIPR